VRRLPLLVLVVALLSIAVPSSPATSVVADRVPAAVAKKSPRALFFGDSYFVGGGCSPDRTQDMAWLAGVELGYRPVVRGAGGTGFVQANPDYDLPPYLAQIHDGALDVKDPKLVVIQGGSNDVGQPADQVRKNARKVLKIARGKYPHAVLALVGPMDTYGGYDDSIPIRNALKSVAKKLHVPFIDAMKWTAGRDDLLCSDYVHPTYAGHIYLGHLLAAALKERGA
jgi:lysophospholipase L1-like esterase